MGCQNKQHVDDFLYSQRGFSPPSHCVLKSRQTRGYVGAKCYLVNNVCIDPGYICILIYPLNEVYIFILTLMQMNELLFKS